jgi:Fungal specific transcription factor domain
LDNPGAVEDESDVSDDDNLTTKHPEIERLPAERHAFFFRHNLEQSVSDLRKFHPLPSQIPFLLDVFSENVNCIIRIVYFPTVKKIVRDMRSNNMSSLTPANEALLFSIYYSAIVSLEEEDVSLRRVGNMRQHSIDTCQVMTNFGVTKAELTIKFRLGLEHALAKADFLNVPDLVLVQALAIFLGVGRRHDSPVFVWMMTGILIRMGQALGLHRDGSHFEHLTPFEVEMRRRIWLVLCMVDLRASEDQGAEFTITLNSSDTKLPLNINDAEFEPGTTQMPPARKGITDMSFTLVFMEIGVVVKQMAAQSSNGAPSVEEQSRLLKQIYETFHEYYGQYSLEAGSVIDWVVVTIVRLVIAKMTLFIYLPVLFSSRSEKVSDTIKTKLMVAAIEIAEYNHALNAEQACRQWRWLYQSYTHWYSVVYLLMEISRRPWSPIAERAWVALHSQWLVPAQYYKEKHLPAWLPLQNLMAKAKRHRDTEFERLRSDPLAARQLETEDQNIPIPASSGPFPAGSDAVQRFRDRWRKILAMPQGSGNYLKIPGEAEKEASSTSRNTHYSAQPSTSSTSVPNAMFTSADNFSAFVGDGGLQPNHPTPSDTFVDLQLPIKTDSPGDFTMDHFQSPENLIPPTDTTWSMGPGFVPSLWPVSGPSAFAGMEFDATNVNMDLDDEINWYSWIESAKGLELDADFGGNRQG